ncbi:MAG: hypothetical protein AAF383_25795 [Cyanobacteria bacterium P01_A01_bin.83]
MILSIPIASPVWRSQTKINSELGILKSGGIQAIKISLATPPSIFLELIMNNE